MRGFLGTRIAQIIPTLLLVSVLVFCLQQLMPGDPALVMAGEERGDPQVLAQIRAELWLDRPLPVQYCIGWAMCCRATWDIRGAFASRCRN